MSRAQPARPSVRRRMTRRASSGAAASTSRGDRSSPPPAGAPRLARAQVAASKSSSDPRPRRRGRRRLGSGFASLLGCETVVVFRARAANCHLDAEHRSSGLVRPSRALDVAESTGPGRHDRATLCSSCSPCPESARSRWRRVRLCRPGATPVLTVEALLASAPSSAPHPGPVLKVRASATGHPSPRPSPPRGERELSSLVVGAAPRVTSLPAVAAGRGSTHRSWSAPDNTKARTLSGPPLDSTRS